MSNELIEAIQLMDFEQRFRYFTRITAQMYWSDTPQLRRFVEKLNQYWVVL